MNKRILYLTAAYPYGIGGGSFANHAYLRAISEIYRGDIDVLFADSWNNNWDYSIEIGNIYNAAQRSAFRTAISFLTGEITRFSEPAKKIIEENHSKYSCIVSNGSSISGNISGLAHKHNIKVVTIHHNYEPEYFSDNNSGLKKVLYNPWVKYLEKNAYLNSDYNLFLTKQDLEKFKSVYGVSKGKCDVIGVFEYEDYKLPHVTQKVRADLTFIITGSLCTMQGVDGIQYFFKELYQYLPKNCTVVIAGRSPSSEVKSLSASHRNVTLISNPDDMSEVISLGDVYICPTRMGGGLKLRVMDGLKLGIPVITHTCSARGYDAFYDTNWFRSFSTPEEFNVGLEFILSNMVSTKKENIIHTYKDSFSYASGLQRMRQALLEL